MEKKKLLTFGILSFFAIALVTAGIVLYQGQFSDKINVYSPIEVLGSESNYLGEDSAGTTVEGSPFTMENIEDFGVLVRVSSDAEEGIDVEYKSDLQLTKKTVNFNLDVWVIPNDAEKVEIEYTIVGESFSAEVTDDAKEGYVLVYYVDNDDRFANPGEAVLVEDVSENLPATHDENSGLNDYSLEYSTTPFGAKIWYVPSSALNEGVIDWSMADQFYFESKLIQYNAEGEIVMYPGMFLELTPEYTIDLNFVGNTTVTNYVENIALA